MPALIFKKTLVLPWPRALKNLEHDDSEEAQQHKLIYVPHAALYRTYTSHTHTLSILLFPFLSLPFLHLINLEYLSQATETWMLINKAADCLVTRKDQDPVVAKTHDTIQQRKR